MRSHLLFTCNKDPSSVFKVDCEIYRAPLTEFYLLIRWCYLYRCPSTRYQACMFWMLHLFPFFLFAEPFPYFLCHLTLCYKSQDQLDEAGPRSTCPCGSIRWPTCIQNRVPSSAYDIPSIFDNKYCTNINEWFWYMRKYVYTLLVITA